MYTSLTMTLAETNGSHRIPAHPDAYATRAIHVGSEPDPTTGAVVPSLSVATTFLQDGVNRHRGHEYSRSSNPTRSILESLLTSLETIDSSGESLIFSSGSAATAALASWVSLALKEGGAGGTDGLNGGGGHVLAVNDVVGDTLAVVAHDSMVERQGFFLEQLEVQVWK